jgi:FAD/FMN-containing dehydrogenase
MKLSRRTLLGTGVVAGGAIWGGASAARLMRDPSGPKDAGRVGDIDGIDLAREASPNPPGFDPSLRWKQRGGTLNDASALSRTPVFGVVEISGEDDVAGALAFARANGLKVSMAAVRHSMGGHAFEDNALVLDMMTFNRVDIDAGRRTIRVQPGATWHQIQNLLHPRFAVKAMQSTDIFSVGGSISVNAHGMDHQAGALAGSIRSLRVMMADGSVRTCSRTQDPELFRHVVGGYGLFGVIVEAELDIVENAVYRTAREVIRSADFPAYFSERIEGDTALGLFYGHLSTAPGNLLDDMIVYRYEHAADRAPDDMPGLGAPGAVKLKRLIMNLAKRGGLFQTLKWHAEKSLEPLVESCTVPRTAAMGEGEACFVSRNNPMHDSVPYLFNDLPEETDILNEYFIPRAAYNDFIAASKQVLAGQDLPILNASVRIVDAEDVALAYAHEPAFSLVLYVNQPTTEDGNARMRALTRAMIDVTLDHGGRFFLPYQLHYTGAQLMRSYPELPSFLAVKKRFDPEGLFTSTFHRAIEALAASG